MSWRDEPPTEKQLEFINGIYCTINNTPYVDKIPRFTGTTKGEASDYITRYKESYEELLDWQLSMSLYNDVMQEILND